MAGFTDLVQQAQPALVEVNGRATEGRTWRWEFGGVVDSTGANIDLSGVTGVCAVLDTVSGTQIIALTFTGGLGSFVIGATQAATAGLAPGVKARNCVWGLVLTSGGESVQVWSPAASKFIIDPE